MNQIVINHYKADCGSLYLSVVVTMTEKYIILEEYFNKIRIVGGSYSKDGRLRNFYDTFEDAQTDLNDYILHFGDSMQIKSIDKGVWSYDEQD